MKNSIIALLITICSIAHAGNVIRLGETNPKVRKLGETVAGSHTLKGPATPKQKESTSHKQDVIKNITDAPFRKWTSQNGNSIKAQLKGLSSTAAIFEQNDGKKFKIAKNDLVEADRDYLNQYEKTGKFPPVYTKKNIIIAISAVSSFLLFAIWFIKSPKKTKYQAPKRNITIGTGL